MTPVPAVAVTVPLQVFDVFGGLDTASVALPAPLLNGNVSLKATPVRSPAAVVFGFVIVNFTVPVPLIGIVASTSVAVPPPEAARPEAPTVYVNCELEGVPVIVNVPLYPATPTPVIVTG